MSPARQDRKSREMRLSHSCKRTAAGALPAIATSFRVAIRSHTLQKFEEITAGGNDKGRIFRDDGLVGLHGPCEFIERHGFRALVVSLRVDFGGFGVRDAADLLDLPVGFRLDLIQITQTIAADSGGLAVAFRQEAFRDLPPFTGHSIVNLRAYACIVVDPLESDVEQFDTKHANLLGRLGKDLLL